MGWLCSDRLIDGWSRMDQSAELSITRLIDWLDWLRPALMCLLICQSNWREYARQHVMTWSWLEKHVNVWHDCHHTNHGHPDMEQWHILLDSEIQTWNTTQNCKTEIRNWKISVSTLSDVISVHCWMTSFVDRWCHLKTWWRHRPPRSLTFFFEFKSVCGDPQWRLCQITVAPQWRPQFAGSPPISIIVTCQMINQSLVSGWLIDWLSIH